MNKIARVRRNIYRLRLERRFLFEKAATGGDDAPPSPRVTTHPLSLIQKQKAMFDEKKGLLHVLSNEASREVTPALGDE